MNAPIPDLTARDRNNHDAAHVALNESGLARHARIPRFLLKNRIAGVSSGLRLKDALPEMADPHTEGRPEEFARDLKSAGPGLQQDRPVDVELPGHGVGCWVLERTQGDAAPLGAVRERAN